MSEHTLGRPPRLVWVDAARGMSILLVVLFHVLLWHVGPHRGEMWLPADRMWAKFNAVLGSVRLPLLLGLSGLVTSRRIRAGLGDRQNLVRAASSYYLYVIWLLVYAVFFALVSAPGLPHRIDGLNDVLFQLVSPDTTLWFVYALALYAIALPSLHRIPGPLQIMLLALLCVVARSVDIEARQTLKIFENIVFFGVGVHAAPWLRRLAERATVPRALLAAVAAAVVTLGGRVMTGHVLGSILFMARGLAFLVLAVLCIAVAVRWRTAGTALSAIGRQTLPIYVLHPLMIYSVMALTPEESWLTGVLATPAGALLYPVILVAVMAIVSLLLHRVMMYGKLGLIFAMPSGWRSRILAGGRAARRRSAG